MENGEKELTDLCKLKSTLMAIGMDYTHIDYGDEPTVLLKGTYLLFDKEGKFLWQEEYHIGPSKIPGVE